MRVELTVTAGPHAGAVFAFDRHDTFLVGRGKDAHFQISADDPYFSRRHFLVEVNPPRARLTDLNSRNGVEVNGRRVTSADLRHGDEVRAGDAAFRVAVGPDDPDRVETLPLPGAGPRADHPAGDAGQATLFVPGYRIGAEIGRGAMGAVYRAERAADGSPVALKTLCPAAGAGGKDVQRFLKEARILGELRHANVVGFVEAGDLGEVLYIAMELVDGPDAGRVVRDRGPLPVTKAVRLACQALAGLAAAHAAGVVHRDVKPSNLLTGGPPKNRVVKVADFGLARAYEASRLSGVTLQGEACGGTPAFMAPEQVTHYRDVRPAADQYSMASTLYYLLTGCHTHDFPADLRGRLIAVTTDPAVPIRDRRRDIPAGLAAAVHKALSREAEDRYPDARAFRTVLRAFAG